jgi:hypothetical protein
MSCLEMLSDPEVLPHLTQAMRDIVWKWSKELNTGDPPQPVMTTIFRFSHIENAISIVQHAACFTLIAERYRTRFFQAKIACDADY